MAVVTEQFNESKHGKTSVLKFRELAAFEFFVVKRGVGFRVEEESVVVNGTDQEEDLGPTQCRDGFDGLDAVGDGISADLSGDEVVVGTGEFRENISEHTKLGNASVLEFTFTVTIESFLVNVGGKAKGVCRRTVENVSNPNGRLNMEQWGFPS